MNIKLPWGKQEKVTNVEVAEVSTSDIEVSEEVSNDNSSIRILPMPPNQNNQEEIDTLGTCVILGANGSGKTRLGTWLEFDSPIRNKVHRLAAQKSLTFPNSISTMKVDVAQRTLLYGDNSNFEEPVSIDITPQILKYEIDKMYQNKNVQRWKSNPHTGLLDDFVQLLSYLLSEQAQQSVEACNAAKLTHQNIVAPTTKMDIIKRIWETLLPHRELIVNANNIQSQVREGAGKAYDATEMSDGERVIFYLIGQCLSVPEGEIIVIDEPELHVHKALQSPLWDAIEAQRSDCLFVYITHDLDFALSRQEACKICLRSYDGEHWDWYVVPDSENIPEEIFLQIIGGRKPVLFVEGEQSSLDLPLYQRLYPAYHIIPRGGCEQVIASTTSFSALKLHHLLDCAGIVDGDKRTDEQISKLERLRVYTLKVAEIENLYLLEDVLKFAAEKLHIDNFPDIMGKIKTKMLESLMSEKVRLASEITTNSIETLYKSFNAKAQGKFDIQASLDKMTESIDIGKVYDEAMARIDGILATNNYNEALRVYDQKGFINSISSDFSFRPGELQRYLKRLINKDEGKPIIDAMCQFVPNL